MISLCKSKMTSPLSERSTGFAWLLLAFAEILLVACPQSQAHAQRMREFEPTSQESDVIAMRVPAWMRGRITSDGAIQGSVRRKALGNSEAVSLFGITIGGAERFGRFSFEIATGDAKGPLRGDCVYDRTERKLGIGKLVVSHPLRPLFLSCRFEQNETTVGKLEVAAAPRTDALIQPARRTGHVEIAGTKLGIESEHRMRGAKVPTDLPVGYHFLADRTSVGSVDLTGFTKRVIALPRTGSDRLAALAAGVALSVFWDPNDTDD